MNKSELIEHIAKQADISKSAAARSLDALIGAVKTTLKKGGTVTITGFGTFAVSKSSARVGRNPRTGDFIKIKATKLPKFRPGQKFVSTVAGQYLLDPVAPEPEADKRPPKRKSKDVPAKRS